MSLRPAGWIRKKIVSTQVLAVFINDYARLKSRGLRPIEKMERVDSERKSKSL